MTGRTARSTGLTNRTFALRLLLGIHMCLVSSCGKVAPLRGTVIDPPRYIPAFTFTRGSGATYSTAAESDKFSVVFFGYTHCPDICPTTLADWARVRGALGDNAKRVRWMFVSIDPERDTPAIADEFAQRFDSSFVGLSGDSATTSKMLAAFGISAIREPGATSMEYLMSHSSQVFLVDPLGRWVAMYSAGSGWDALRDDLQRLL